MNTDNLITLYMRDDYVFSVKIIIRFLLKISSIYYLYVKKKEEVKEEEKKRFEKFIF